MIRDWKSTAGVLLIFVLGCFAGAFLALIVVHHRTQVFLKRGSPAFEELLERRLSRGLHLDEGQRERFHEVLAANIESRKKLQQQIQPEVRDLNEQTQQEIAAILNPGQREKLHKNLQDFRRQFGPPGLGRPPRPDEAATNAPPIGNSNAAPQTD